MSISRQKTLHIGLETPSLQICSPDSAIVHVPFIKIIPRPVEDPGIQCAFALFPAATHLIFTSKQAVNLFFDYALLHQISIQQFSKKRIGAIGKQTAARIFSCGVPTHFIAEKETLEGMIEKLEAEDLSSSCLIWPRSSLSRPLLIEWLSHNHVRYCAAPFYDTVAQLPSPLPDLTDFHEILFTSPSTVDAFLAAYSCLPQDKRYRTIGPITEKYITTILAR